MKNSTTIISAFRPNTFLIICLIYACRDKYPRNIRLTEIKKKQMAHITHCLKAFLSFVVAEHREKDPHDEEIRQERDTLFDTMLGDAISFNNTVNADPGSEFMVSVAA